MATTETWAELTKLSEEEMIRKHDELAKRIVVGTAHYLEELRYRRAAHISQDIECFTKWICVMTVVITLATIVNVLAVFRVFG